MLGYLQMSFLSSFVSLSFCPWFETIIFHPGLFKSLGFLTFLFFFLKKIRNQSQVSYTYTHEFLVNSWVSLSTVMSDSCVYQRTVTCSCIWVYISPRFGFYEHFSISQLLLRLCPKSLQVYCLLQISIDFLL